MNSFTVEFLSRHFKYVGLVWNVKGRVTGNITQEQYGELPGKSHPCNSVGYRHKPSDIEVLTLINPSAERNEHGAEFRLAVVDVIERAPG
jgi:hypothetical protein